MSHQQPELPIFQRMRIISFVKSEPEKFTPCRNLLSSMNTPLFMDNLSQIPYSSMNMPLFMDNLSQIPHSSMNMPLFMDNPVQNPLSSMNMPHFMDNPVQNPLSSIKPPLFMDNTHWGIAQDKISYISSRETPF